MKTGFTTILLAISALALSSCTYVTKEEGNGAVTVFKNIDMHLGQNAWKYSYQDNNNYFYAEFDVPEIDRKMFDGGMVKMYRVYNYKTDKAAQYEMPFSNHVEWYSSEDNLWYFYNEKLDYEFSVGKVTVFYQVSDFNYEIDETFVPEAMEFRLVLLN